MFRLKVVDVSRDSYINKENYCRKNENFHHVSSSLLHSEASILFRCYFAPSVDKLCNILNESNARVLYNTFNGIRSIAYLKTMQENRNRFGSKITNFNRHSFDAIRRYSRVQYFPPYNSHETFQNYYHSTNGTGIFNRREIVNGAQFKEKNDKQEQAHG